MVLQRRRRACPSGAVTPFGAAVNVTVPFADPPAGALIVIDGVVVVAVHGVPG